MENPFYIVDGKLITLYRADDKKAISFNNRNEKLKILNIIADINSTKATSATTIFCGSSIIIESGTDDVFEKIQQEDDLNPIRSCYRDFLGNEMYLTDEVIVKFDSTTDEFTKKEILNKFACIKIDTLPELGNVLVVRVKNLEPDAPLYIANQLTELNNVEYAEPNFIQKGESLFDPIFEPLFEKQWYLLNTGQFNGIKGVDIGILEAWKIADYGDPSIVVAIHDEGVDIYHREFEARIAAGAWDFDHPEDGNPSNANSWHGTACAGIVAGALDGRGIVGVAPKCQILPIKVAHNDKNVVKVCKSLLYAAKKSQIISCSWRLFHESNCINNTLRFITTEERGKKGVPCVFAAGNNSGNELSYPANHPFVISVGACTYMGKYAPYSNKGRGLVVVAPSHNDDIKIFTADIYGRFGNTQLNSPEGDYTYFGGTSACAPQVAGAIALMLSVNPNLNAREIKNILQDTADKIDVQFGDYINGWSPFYGFGKLNVSEAVKLAKNRFLS